LMAYRAGKREFLDCIHGSGCRRFRAKVEGDLKNNYSLMRLTCVAKMQ
jgi:hypothetical protein